MADPLDVFVSEAYVWLASDPNRTAYSNERATANIKIIGSFFLAVIPNSSARTLKGNV